MSNLVAAIYAGIPCYFGRNLNAQMDIGRSPQHPFFELNEIKLEL